MAFDINQSYAIYADDLGNSLFIQGGLYYFTYPPYNQTTPPSTGGGPSGGPVTISDGSDVTEGSITDNAVAAGAIGTISAKLRAISRDIGALFTGGQRTQITDGTNNAAVKASSTAAAVTDPALVVALSPGSQLPGLIRPDNEYLVSMDPTSLFYDTYDISLDVTDRWTSGGTVPSVATGVLTINPNTTALAVSSLVSKASFQLLGNMFNEVLGIVKTDATLKTGNYRAFGFMSLPGSPTVAAPITDGAVFEWNDSTGDLSAVIWSGGIKSQSVSLTSVRPSDGNYHRYVVYYKTSRAYFEIDRVVVASVANPAPNTSVLSIGYVSVNGASTVTPAAVLQSNFSGVGDSARNNNSLSDGSFPWRKATIKGPSTQPAAVDPALVVTLSPNSIVPALLGTTSGSITTQNLNLAGAATAGSAVEITLFGAQAITIQVSGTYTGSLGVQFTLDGANWVTGGGGMTLVNINTAAYSTLILGGAVGIYQASGIGAFKARLTATTAITGTAVVTLTATSSAQSININTALPTGTNSIGNIGTLATLTTLANGQTAHSSASTGSPIRIGGRVQAAVDTTLLAGDASDQAMTTGGASISKPYAPPEVDWLFASAAGGIINTADNVLKAAGAANVRNYLTGIQIVNASATIATEVVVKDGGSTVLWRGYVGAGASLLNSVGGVTFPNPLRGTAATAMNAACITTGAAVYVNAQGYQGI